MFGIGNYMGLGMGMGDCYPYYSAMANTNYGTPPMVKQEGPDKFIKSGEDSYADSQSKTAKVIAYGTLGIVAAALMLKGKLIFGKIKKYGASTEPGVFRRIGDWFGEKKTNIKNSFTDIKTGIKNKKNAKLNAKSEAETAASDAETQIEN